MNTGPTPVTQEMLDACAREPIHIPGAIQAHGVLLTISDPAGIVQQATANCLAWTGVAAPELVGSELRTTLPELAGLLAQEGPWGPRPRLATQPLSLAGRMVTVNVHRAQGVLIVEMEESDAGTVAAPDLEILDQLAQDLAAAHDLPSTCALAATAVHAISAYDRVMIYGFTEEGHGEVRAECNNPGVESFLGQRYPASDIPPQARAMFRHLRVRVIADSAHTPVPLLPRDHPHTGAPLDLSCCALRAVSPIHLEYLRNMQVGASLTAGIFVDDRLWGMVACHQCAPRRAGMRQRQCIGIAADMVAARIAELEAHHRLQARIDAFGVQREVLAGIGVDERREWTTELMVPERVLPLMHASGAVLVWRGAVVTAGEVPPSAETGRLIAWLRTTMTGSLHHFDHLGAHLPELAPFADRASGCLAVRISGDEDDLLIWLRPEQVRSVTWAGDPRKPPAPDGPQRLSPRTSFAAWKEIVRGRSREWSVKDRAAAEALRHHLRDVVGRVLAIRRALVRSNRDLSEFALAAANDLQRPLLTIQESCARLSQAGLPPAAAEDLRAAVEGARHGQALIQDLLTFANLDNDSGGTVRVDLDDVCRETIATLHQDIAACGATIDVDHLPTVDGSPRHLAQLFHQLISNALKYRSDTAPLITITGRRMPGAWEIAISDNGLGIAPQFHHHIFTMFTRLHGDGRHPGTGVGLALCKRIVDLHGGRIWVESQPDHGSTFRFTIADAGGKAG